MPYSVTEFQPTPNPNALKCILDREIAPGPRSYRSRTQAPSADQDAVAAAIFEIPTVTGLLLSGNWITVLKDPSTDWGTLKPIVTGVLSRLA